jgi:hypothetical protein
LVFACVFTGMIKGIFFSKGIVHDFQMFKHGKFKLSQEITLLVDLGFLGIQHIHNQSILPHKKTKLKPLTAQQKEQNKAQASKRVMIEHCNRYFKIFRICGSRYRGKHKNYDTNWTIISAIINLKIATRNLKFTEF